MNGRAWAASVAWALVCVTASPAGAADAGFYVTASLGQGREDPESAGTNVGNSMGVFHVDPVSVDVDDGALAWSVGLGYRINRYLSGELEYVDFGSTGIVEHYSVPNPAPFPFPTEFDFDFSSRVTGPVVSLLGTLPVGNQFEVYLRGGALFANREYSMNGFGTLDENFASTVWLAGAGVTWSPARHWSIRAEYQQTGTLGKTLVAGETDLERMSLSAVFRF